MPLSPLFFSFFSVRRNRWRRREDGEAKIEIVNSVWTTRHSVVVSAQGKRQGGGGYLKLEFSASSSFIDDDDSRGGYVNIDWGGENDWVCECAAAENDRTEHTFSHRKPARWWWSTRECQGEFRRSLKVKCVCVCVCTEELKVPKLALFTRSHFHVSLILWLNSADWLPQKTEKVLCGEHSAVRSCDDVCVFGNYRPCRISYD